MELVHADTSSYTAVVVGTVVATDVSRVIEEIVLTFITDYGMMIGATVYGVKNHSLILVGTEDILACTI